MTITNNLKTIHSLNHVFSQATACDILEGRLWYQSANRFAVSLSNASGYTLDTICRLIAVLSPACSWEQNKTDAWDMATAKGSLKDVTVSTYGANKAKAIDILEGNPDAIGGRKVTAFYHNILNPSCSDHVTIDRHAIKAAIGKKAHKGGSLAPTAKQYNLASNLYKKLAAKHNLVPCEAQAVIWVTYKRINNT